MCEGEGVETVNLRNTTPLEFFSTRQLDEEKTGKKYIKKDTIPHGGGTVNREEMEEEDGGKERKEE